MQKSAPHASASKSFSDSPFALGKKPVLCNMPCKAVHHRRPILLSSLPLTYSIVSVLCAAASLNFPSCIPYFFLRSLLAVISGQNTTLSHHSSITLAVPTHPLVLNVDDISWIISDVWVLGSLSFISDAVSPHISSMIIAPVLYFPVYFSVSPTRLSGGSQTVLILITIISKPLAHCPAQ